jgi:hypothetical protein
VNFLLHHHLAARDLGSAAAGAGAMLPDLWRMADRRVRPAPAVTWSAEPGDDAVLAGIAHHVEADRWFHHDAVFTGGEREAGALLREARLAAPRSTLFAHILWELCLDGALLRREGLARVLGSLRAGLDEARAGADARAVERHHFGRVPRTTAERDAFDRRLGRILDEVARGPWIDGYQTGAGIAARIQGVRAAVGLTPMDHDDVARFAGVADALLDRAPAAVERILAQGKAGSIAAPGGP